MSVYIPSDIKDIMLIEHNDRELFEGLFDKILSRYRAFASPFIHYFGKERVDVHVDCSFVMFWRTMLSYKHFKDKIPELSYDMECAQYISMSDENREKVALCIKGIIEDNHEFDSLYKAIVSWTNLSIAYVIVHFPEVEVTNENNKSVIVYDLFTRTIINFDGRMESSGFTMNRSTYQLSHLKSDYMHSHVNGTNVACGEIASFKTPCFGRGPILETISRLSSGSFKYDKDVWLLYCVEMDKFVHTESIEGVPYRYLERIGDSGDKVNINTIYTKIPRVSSTPMTKVRIADFVKYVIKSKELKFNFINGSYSLGMSMVQYMVTISNLFVKWYNSTCFDCTLELLLLKRVLINAVIKDNAIYRKSDWGNAVDYERYIGRTVIIFRGQEFYIKIIDIEENENNGNRFLMLNNEIAVPILNSILKVLNFRYGRNKTESGKEGEVLWKDGIPIKTDVLYV